MLGVGYEITLVDHAQCIHPIRNDFLVFRKLTNQSARFGHTHDIPTFFTATNQGSTHVLFLAYYQKYTSL